MRSGDRLSAVFHSILSPRRAVQVVAVCGLFVVGASSAAAAPTSRPVAPVTPVASASRLGIMIVSHPAKATRSRTASFRWKVAGRPSRVVCSLGRRAFTRCHQPARYAKLADGRHRFRVRVISRSAASTATYRWRVDTVAPKSPQVTGGSAAWQSVAQVDVAGGSSTDSGSGVAGYEFRLSGDGGVTWSAPISGTLAAVVGEGETFVQFRARDRAGNVSAWAPALGDAGTVRIDRTAPSDPLISGGSLEWQNAASVAVSAAGAIDIGGSGFAGYQYRTSSDGGVMWSSPSPGAIVEVSADGETLVEFQALDAAGNASDWQPTAAGATNTVRIDRSLPTTPTVTGGSSIWQSVASVTLTADGSADGTGGSGIDHYEYRESSDEGNTWSAPIAGLSDTVSAEGETLVAFRAVDTANLASAWMTSTVRIDRTAPSDPLVDGGAAGWQTVAFETVSAGSSNDSDSGVDHYEYRESTDAGATWSTPVGGSADTVSVEGQTLVGFRAVDGAGNPSGWVTQLVSIDRTAPTAPTSVSGGSAAWQNVVSVTVSASAATDSDGSGLAGYEHRTSTDGGATWSAPTAGPDATVSDEGETLIEFRAVDVAGNLSGWTPVPPDAAGIVRIDRSGPTDPSIAGGSPIWKSTASVTISASGSADPASGIAHYEYQTSTDGGTNWSSPTSGSSAAVTAEGETLVRFRAVDNAGNSSAWSPAAAGADNTVRIDRTAPTNPVVTGGSTSWQSIASITISGAGSTDNGGSGLAGYQYRTSTNNGVTWTAQAPGASTGVTAEGSTLVQFRALDNAGNSSAWSPAAAGASNTARIDRTAPTAPAVTGGATSCVRKRTIKASGATDTLSGIDHYEYHSSMNGGAYTAPATGASASFKTTGTYTVQFRVFDKAGNSTAWAPAANSSANTACIR
jgi:hypothetical protein